MTDFPSSPVTETLKHWQRVADKLQNQLRTSAGHETPASRLAEKTFANVRQKTELVLTSGHAQRQPVQDALEHARAYIDADVASMEPGWRSAKAIVELIDAALTDTSTPGNSK